MSIVGRFLCITCVLVFYREARSCYHPWCCRAINPLPTLFMIRTSDYGFISLFSYTSGGAALPPLPRMTLGVATEKPSYLAAAAGLPSPLESLST